MGSLFVWVHDTLPSWSRVVRSPMVMIPASIMSLVSSLSNSDPRLCWSRTSCSTVFARAVPPIAIFCSRRVCIWIRLDIHPSSCIECIVALCIYVGGHPLKCSARCRMLFIALAVAGFPSSAVCSSCCFCLLILVDILVNS